MTQAYRIYKYSAEDNRYGIDRTETWVLKKDKLFRSENEAQDYICEQTYILVPDVVRLTIGLSKEGKEKFIREFSLGNDSRYLLYRIFFTDSNMSAVL